MTDKLIDYVLNNFDGGLASHRYCVKDEVQVLIREKLVQVFRSEIRDGLLGL